MARVRYVDLVIANFFQKETLYKEIVSKVLAENFRGKPLHHLKKLKTEQIKDTAKEKKKQDEFSSKKGNPLKFGLSEKYT